MKFQILNEKNRDKFISLYTNLNDDDRAIRFAHRTSLEYAKKYATEFSFAENVVFGAFDADVLIGSIEIVDHGCDLNSVEIALVVDESHRRLGVGSKLFKKAMQYISNMGYRKVHSLCVTDNSPMMHLVKKNGFSVTLDSGQAHAIKIDTPIIYSLSAFGNDRYKMALELMHDHSITEYRNFWKLLGGFRK